MAPSESAPAVSRRRLLAVAGTGLAALAGCAGAPETDSPESGDPATGEPPSEDATGGNTTTPREPESLGDVAGTWPQRGADPGHAGATDAAGLPEGSLPYWRLRRIRSGPTVLADGRLFHYAELNEDPGAPATLTPTADPDDGPAHIVNGPPYLLAREAADGAIAWAAPLPDRAGGWPAAADGRVVATPGGRVSVHDAADGETLWTDDLGDQPLGDPTVVGDAVVVPLQGVVEGESGEYVHEPAVRAYDLADGTERWTAPMPKRGLGVAAAGDTVAVLANDFDESTAVVGLAQTDGSERWRTEVPAGFVGQPVAAEGSDAEGDGAGTLYVAGRSETLRALSLADGSRRWARSFERNPTAPAVADGSVYVGVRSTVLALSAGDGTEQWTFDASEAAADSEVEFWAPPTVADGVVYAGATGLDAPLVALDAGDGTARWRHQFPNAVVEGDIVRSGLEAQPTVAEGALFVYAADGLYAFGRE